MSDIMPAGCNSSSPEGRPDREPAPIEETHRVAARIVSDGHWWIRFGTRFSLLLAGFSELRRTAQQLRRPSREVKLSLPGTGVLALENAADVLGVSLETLLVQIVTRGSDR